MYEMFNSMSDKFDSYDVIITGAGIGGLLSAAMLCKRGFSVVVFEKLSFIGGRFTSFNFKGYEIPSGAIHMIPNSNGTFAKILKDFGISFKKLDIFPEVIWEDGRRSRKHMFGICKTFKARLAFIKIIFISIILRKDYVLSFDEYLKNEVKNEELHKFFEVLVNFMFSLSTKDISTRTIFEISRNLIFLGSPIVPIGGCKGVIK